MILPYICAICGSLSIGIILGSWITDKYFHKKYIYRHYLEESLDKAVKREAFEEAAKIQKKLKRYL